MDSVVITVLRIGLLLLLWLFILVALRAMMKDTNDAAGRSSKSKQPRRRKAGSGGSPSSAPPSRITVTEGPYRGSYMDITQVSEIVLGRAQDCDFVLGDDFSSARHARLFRRGSDWYVEDLDSRNGTFVSGTRIDQPERIRTGVDVRVGRTTVRLVP